MEEHQIDVGEGGLAPPPVAAVGHEDKPVDHAPLRIGPGTEIVEHRTPDVEHDAVGEVRGDPGDRPRWRAGGTFGHKPQAKADKRRPPAEDGGRESPDSRHEVDRTRAVFC